MNKLTNVRRGKGERRPRYRVTLQDVREEQVLKIVARELGMTIAQLLRHAAIKLTNEAMRDYTEHLKQFEETPSERTEDSTVGATDASDTEGR